MARIALFLSDMNLQDLGDRIRRQRKRCGLKQIDIANAVQVSPQAVSKWERGENAPDISSLPNLSQLLGVTIEWLLGVYSVDKDVFEATVLAARAKSAREKSEQLEPRNFAAWTNSVCYQLTEAVLRFGGIPIKNRGAGLLCFFSGHLHQERAIDTALVAQDLLPEPLKIGLSTGPIYFGPIGHPDYAQPDIIGEAVSIALLNTDWASENAHSGLAIDAKTLKGSSKHKGSAIKKATVSYAGISHEVQLMELAS